MADINEVMKTVDYGEAIEVKPKYTEFEMAVFEDMQFISTLMSIVPQAWARFQYALRDPKLDPKVRHALQKRIKTFQDTVTEIVDEIWKISHPKTTKAMEAQEMYLRAKKKQLEKLD